MKQNINNKNIIIAAGGTGGHMMPAIEVARFLSNYKYKITFITDERGDKFLKNLKFKIHQIIVISVSNKRSIKNIFLIILNIIKIFFFIFKNNIKLTFSFGSYVSFVLSFASKIAFTKNIIHEQNIVLGLANKISLIFFSKICLTSFSETKTKFKFLNKKIIYVGMPIREEINQYASYNDNFLSLSIFFNNTNNFNITILGGSLGSSIITKTILQSIYFLPEEIKLKLSINHQVRKEDIENTKEQYEIMNIKANVSTFFDDIGKILSSSHLIISRAGASSIFEIITIASPVILIPIKDSAYNHQILNAQYLANNNAAYLLEEKNLNAEKIAYFISNLSENSILLSEMSSNLRKLRSNNANVNIKIEKIIKMLLS